MIESSSRIIDKSPNDFWLMTMPAAPKVKPMSTETITILLVEQNADLALESSHHGYVLETGRIIVQDESAALRRNPQVKSAYLGG